MILPINIKIGNVQVEISTYDKETFQSEVEYTYRSWEDVRNIVDRELQEWEYEYDYKSTRSFSQKSKMKLIVEILRILDQGGVEENILVQEILKTRKFSEDEARIFIKKALLDGTITLENGLYRVSN